MEFCFSKSSFGGLQLVFHFGTENGEGQLKKPPFISQPLGTGNGVFFQAGVLFSTEKAIIWPIWVILLQIYF